MKSLIIGSGEVGIALSKVLGRQYDTYITGETDEKFEVEIIHICFPYSDDFIREVKRYQKLYKPIYTVIHSTVPVGTSTECNAYHSPIRGVHPRLEEGIRVFIKYLAPKSKDLKEYFEKTGIRIKLIDKPENTEALKLWSTTQYKRFIELEKEIYEWCEEKGLDFDTVYTEANETYNEGYKQLGMKNVRRPVLKHMPGEIGGHCILSNNKLLKVELSK